MSGAVRLLGAGDIRDIAGKLGVHPTKKLGQNFVVEQGTVRQIASLAAVRPARVTMFRPYDGCNGVATMTSSGR